MMYVQYISDYVLTKGTRYFAHKGDLWSAFYDYLEKSDRVMVRLDCKLCM